MHCYIIKACRACMPGLYVELGWQLRFARLLHRGKGRFRCSRAAAAMWRVHAAARWGMLASAYLQLVAGQPREQQQ